MEPLEQIYTVKEEKRCDFLCVFCSSSLFVVFIWSHQYGNCLLKSHQLCMNIEQRMKRRNRRGAKKNVPKCVHIPGYDKIDLSGHHIANNNNLWVWSHFDVDGAIFEWCYTMLCVVYTRCCSHCIIICDNEHRLVCAMGIFLFFFKI